MSNLLIVRGTTELALTFGDGSTALVVAPTGSRTSMTIAGGPPGPPGASGDLIFVFTIDGGGADIQTGVKPGLDDLPFTGDIISWTITADAPGDMVADLWKAPFASYPPDASMSITASDKPTLVGSRAAQSALLAGWTTRFNEGESLVPNVETAVGIKLAQLTLRVRRL